MLTANLNYDDCNLSCTSFSFHEFIENLQYLIKSIKGIDFMNIILIDVWLDIYGINEFFDMNGNQR